MNKKYKIDKSDDEWKKQLSEDEYIILRNKGTERPFTGKFNDFSEDGIYTCNACKEELFESDSKFNAHCGWPSFDKSIDSKVEYKKDETHNMQRIEILCNSCGSHLGHIFNDGPTETKMRYCVNSLSLDFNPKK